MFEIFLVLIIAVAIVIALFVAIDYFSAGLGGDARLWYLLKGLVVLAALALVLQRTGVLR